MFLKAMNNCFWIQFCRRGGIGRRAGLKIPFLHGSVGSTPTAGITLIVCQAVRQKALTMSQGFFAGKFNSSVGISLQFLPE